MNKIRDVSNSLYKKSIIIDVSGENKFFKNKKINTYQLKMSKNNYFKNKTILITGANQGLGYQIAKRFAIKNANLILCGRDKKKSNSK